MLTTMKSGKQILTHLKWICYRNLQYSSTQCRVLQQRCSTFPSSLSYCQMRFVHMKWMCHKPRYVHTTAVHQQKHKTPQQSNLPEDKTDDSEISSPKKDIVRQSEVSRPEVKERKSALPDHDVSRITREHIALELNAANIFDELARTKGANKATFLMAVNRYITKESLYRRGATEFIYTGLQQMETFGVKKDVTAYKALLQAFPEGKMIPRNVWQVEFMHYPRQQQCGIDLLEQMEQNAVIPDDEFGTLLKNRFGMVAHVTRKYRRMMYWMPKFKNMNPYPIPLELPDDPIKLALIALRRMCVDKETIYDVYKTAEVDAASEEDTFIASAMSPTQQQLISRHDSTLPLFVEGPYPVYLKEVGQWYFLLRAEPNVDGLVKEKERQKWEASDDNLFEWTNFFEEEECKELKPILSVHEQEDSTVLGLCITGTSSKSSVVTWVRCLEKFNPNLAKTPVLFQLTSTELEVDAIGDSRSFTETKKS